MARFSIRFNWMQPFVSSKMPASMTFHSAGKLVGINLAIKAITIRKSITHPQIIPIVCTHCFIMFDCRLCCIVGLLKTVSVSCFNKINPVKYADRMCIIHAARTIPSDENECEITPNIKAGPAFMQ